MARYIDADVLDDEVMHLFITITGNPKQHTVVNECKNSFRRMIEEQPTADVTSVVGIENIVLQLESHYNIIQSGEHLSTVYESRSPVFEKDYNTTIELKTVIDMLKGLLNG